MKKLLAIMACLLCTTSLFSQSGTLKINVVDAADQEGIVGAYVKLGDGKGGVTDFNGNLSLELEHGNYHAVISFVGYTEVEKDFVITAFSETSLSVQLSILETELDQVVVSAGKFEQKVGEITVSMEILKPDLIENRVTVSCEEIMEQVPGVNMQEDQISIRGGAGFSYGAGSRVLLMVDDMPMLAGDAGDIKWNSLPLENLEQIEVIKGASSVLYGSSALNGVINIRTGYPKGEPRTKVNLYSGVYGNAYADYKGTTRDGKNDSLITRDDQRWWSKPRVYTGANFFHSRQIKSNFDFTAGGAYFKDQGFRVGENEERMRVNFNTRYRSKKIEGLAVGLNTNAQISRGTLFFLWHNADSVLYPSGLTDPETTTLSDYTTYRVNVDPYITYYNKKGWKHSLRNRWYQTRNVNNTNQSATANTYFSEYQIQKRNEEKQLTFTGGTVFMYTGVNSELYGDHSSNNVAVFTQLDKKFFDKLNISAGMRAEYFRIDAEKTAYKIGDKTVPFQPVFRAGANYQLAKATYMRASYGQGYRFPTIGEKFVSTSVGFLKVFQNPLLEAETGTSMEIGIKQGFKVSNFKGFIDIAAFKTTYSNMMEFTFGFFEDDGSAALVHTIDRFGAQSQNAQEAQITGIDMSIMGKGEIGPIEVGVFAGYTFMNPISLNDDPDYIATFSDTSTNMLKYRFNHLIKADVQIGYKKVQAGFSTRFTGFPTNIDAVFVDPFLGDFILAGLDDYRATHSKGDWIFDSRISFKFTESSKLALVCKNLFNREYTTRPGDVAAPRTIVVQYTLKL